MIKTQDCSDCEWYFSTSILPFGTTCAKGHKPRFYDDPDPHKVGHKRKCEDFKHKEAGK